MSVLNSNYICEEILQKFGINFLPEVREEKGEIALILSPFGISRLDGFVIEISITGRTLASRLILGNYAKSLVRKMGEQSQLNSPSFKAFATILIRKNSKLKMVINEKAVNPLVPDEWPTDWDSLLISQKKIPITGDLNDSEYINNELLDCGLDFIGLVLTIMPLVKLEIEEETTEAFPNEGALTRVLVNKYERNKIIRQACIAYYGESCKACGLSFENIYGELGKGFIHVHHLIPLSQIAEEYAVDPIKDLIPVCPNCHYMLHRKDPPYTVDVLKQILKSHNSEYPK